ncbi:MAG: hypothetical protein WBV72_11375 [Nitrososphaeraceae archaeon]
MKPAPMKGLPARWPSNEDSCFDRGTCFACDMSHRCHQEQSAIYAPERLRAVPLNRARSFAVLRQDFVIQQPRI